MNFSRAAAIAAAISMITISAYGLDLRVNGTSVVSPAVNRAELHRSHYTETAAGEVRIVSGVTLGETFPLFYDLFRIEIETVDSRSTLVDDWLAGHLIDAVLFVDRGEWSLWFDGQLFTEVLSVSVFGTPLDADELEVWLGWEGTDLIGAEVERFAELHGIDLTVVVVPNTRSKLVAVSRAGGVPADVVMIQSDFLADLVENDTLQPVDSTVSATAVEKGRAAFAYADRIWAQPFYFDSHLLFFNPELLPEASASPWTLADMEAACADVRNSAALPIAWNAYSAYWLTPFALGFGKNRIVGDQGYVVVDDQPTHDALNYILYLRERGYLEVMERDAMTAYFTSGRVAMILSGSYAIPQFERLGIAFGVRPYPAVPGSDRHVVPFLDFKGLAVPHRARHPVLARRLIQHLSTPAVQAELALSLRKMPAERPAWEMIRELHPHFDVMEYSYEIGTPVPSERAYTVYKSLMWRLLRFVFTDQMTTEEVLRTGDDLLRNSAFQTSTP